MRAQRDCNKPSSSNQRTRPWISLLGNWRLLPREREGEGSSRGEENDEESCFSDFNIFLSCVPSANCQFPRVNFLFSLRRTRTFRSNKTAITTMNKAITAVLASIPWFH